VTETAIRAIDLVKSYDGLDALNNVSLDVRQGERFGLIGPDGAGKTTLIRILCALTPFDSGQALVADFDVREHARHVRSFVGYMPQRFSLYPDLSVAENLRFYADLFGVTAKDRTHRLEELLEFSRLTAFLSRKAGKLSGGMKQKLALACTLIHQPEIIFLDEPTTGVDPMSRHEFWQLLNRLTDRGITLFVTTSYMEEAAQCHRVALMANGKILEVDEPRNICNQYRHPLFHVSTPQPFEAASVLENLPGVLSVQIFSGAIHVAVDRTQGPPGIKRGLKQAGIPVGKIQPIDADIEDVFVDKLTNK
jgi:ABC-2 type transport system ATP-binding protein